MSRTAALLVLCLALAPAAARAAPRPDPSPVGYDLRLRAWGGAFDGLGVREASGPIAIFEASLTPELERGRLALQLPLRFEHRERFDEDLSETILSAAAEPEVRLTRSLRVGAEAGLTWVNRPGWADLYQRQADGTFLPTDRYGYLAWRAGANAWLRAGRGQHLRLRYRYVSYAYEDEPAFLADDPGHLAPLDKAQHELGASWRLLREGWSAAVRLDYAYRMDDVAPARDALSGDPTPGGIANPLQRLSTFEPSLDVQLSALEGRLDLSLSYGLGVQDDRFAGYYSYTEHHPRLSARAAISRPLEATLELEGRWRRYGPDSTDPARLESGTRRTDTRLGVTGELAYALGGGFALRAEARYLSRDTNFPDYVPNGTPPDYDIDWDRPNTQVLAGVEWRASREAGRRR